MAYNSFDETILGLLDIATQAGYMFEKSSNYVTPRSALLRPCVKESYLCVSY